MRKAGVLLVIFIFSFLIVQTSGVSAGESNYWVKNYGGNGDDIINDVKILPDGSIIAVGYTTSTNAGDKNALVMKINPDGSLAWAKTYGGTMNDVAGAVAVTSGGNIIVVGYTKSYGAGGRDVWVLLLGPAGGVIWQKTYGGSSDDWANAVTLTPNYDIIVAGITDSFGSGASDVWVLRLDGKGNIKWQKTYGGKSWEMVSSVDLALNGDIIVSGWTDSFGAGKKDIWVLRLDSDGNVKWQKTYGGNNDDEAHAVALAPNGDIIVIGGTWSFGSVYEDVWVLRLDGKGNIKWQKTYGASDADHANSIAIAPDGDIIVAGYTVNFGAGAEDVWVLRLDGDGNIIWQKTYGGMHDDVANSVAIVPNGDIIVAGYTWSFSTGGWDVWILCLPYNGDLSNCDLCTNSNVEVHEPQVIITDSTAWINISDAKVAESNAYIYQSNLKVRTQCPYRSVATTTKSPLHTSTQVSPLPTLSTSSSSVDTVIQTTQTTIGIPTYSYYIIVGFLSLGLILGVVVKLKGGKPSGGVTPTPEATFKPVTNFPSELLSRYEPLEFLGEGGFAKVFKVKRKSDGKIIALKVPNLDEKARKFFLKEIKAWRLLDHPNIVKLYNAYDEPLPHLEIEFVDGVKLNGEVIRDLGKYPKPVGEEKALNIIRGIAEGLKHAHSKQVYHRDLKPQNVLITSDLTPKITDWGLAKVGAVSTTATTTKGLTLLYAAPEQLDEETYGHTDHRTDIYQLGLIFYELLTGKLPYQGTSPAVVMAKVINPEVKPKPPSHFNKALAKYDGIFEKLLAKRKEDRYQNIDEFLKDLELMRKLDAERKALEKTVEKTKTTMSLTTDSKELRKLKRQVVEQLARLALLHAQLNDKAELINALEDLKAFSKEHRGEIENAIGQFELMMRESVPVSKSTLDELKVLLHRIQQEVEG